MIEAVKFLAITLPLWALVVAGLRKLPLAIRRCVVVTKGRSTSFVSNARRATGAAAMLMAFRFV
jgi:hypothetical protein